PPDALRGASRARGASRTSTTGSRAVRAGDPPDLHRSGGRRAPIPSGRRPPTAGRALPTRARRRARSRPRSRVLVHERTLAVQPWSSGRSDAAPPGSLDQLVAGAFTAAHTGSCAIVTYRGVPPGHHCPNAQMSWFEAATAIVTTLAFCATETACESVE